MYLFVINKNILKFTIHFSKAEKQNSVKLINRKISRSKMAEINLINICQALLFVMVSHEILFTKGELSRSGNIDNNNNNNNNSNNNNDNNNDNNLRDQEILR